MTLLIIATVITAVFLLCLYIAYRHGRRIEKANASEEILDDIHTANMARQRLLHDPDYAARVRNTFEL